MLFSSLTFLYYFLPVVLLLYFIVPASVKNMVLLFASLVFYGWGEPKYVILMIVSILAGYGSGLLIEAFFDTRYKKWIGFFAVLLQLSNLFYFKYAGFFLENVNHLLGGESVVWKILLPVGISFYTFQMISYLVDVYRGEVKAQRNLISLAAYISMFPQLIAGPIVRYSDIEKQLKYRVYSWERFAEGAGRFCAGLCKKVLLANPLGELCDIFKGSGDQSVLFFWLYALSFTLHIYYDFSGYSDMAIGLGRILGFDFMENFNYPYLSRSVTEFWRRWHMSLGTWFRDYVYIPLGGSRCSVIRHFFNIFVVWMLTGFWHGAQWNFLLWGIFYAVFLIIEKTWLLKYLEKGRIWPHFYLIFVVMTGFVIFNAADVAEAGAYLAGMFGLSGHPAVSREFFYYLKSYLGILLISVAGICPFVKASYYKLRYKAAWIEPAVFFAGMILSTAFLADGAFNPFLYFRF